MEHYFTNNLDLKSELRIIKYHYQDRDYDFYSDLGVFSKDKIDYGSKLLIDAYIKNGKENVKLLDVGCGYGIIGISLAILKNVLPTLIDVNKRAVHLTEMNLKKHHVNGRAIVSNIYDSVEGKFDVIITNPPIRAGKKVIYEIFDRAYDYLEDDGSLYIVIRKDQGAKSAIEHLSCKYDVKILDKNKGFYVLIAKKLLTPT